IPKDWSKFIVQGKAYDTTEVIGRQLWEQIELTIEKYSFFDRKPSNKSQLVLQEPETRYREDYLTKVRLGQGAFRVQLTDAYKRKCAISGEKTLPVLDAAHIKPYAESGPHHIENGILLRADIHKLFDSGYLTLTDSYVVEVSNRIKEEFQNGKDYYKYHGSKLSILPNDLSQRPSSKYIQWHNQNIYNG
ncbi:MAG: HNH endonuclease, partial [Bacteroidota bacterium]